MDGSNFSKRQVQGALNSPRPVYFLGDSHVRYFGRGAEHGLYLPRAAECIEVGGATAVGMRNPNAKTNALGHFRKFLDQRKKAAFVVLQLGEVDCDYVAWFRAAKYGEPVEDQVAQSIASYLTFVDESIGAGFQNVIITSATLPTITDDDQAARLIINRSDVTASQRDRTDLTAFYNGLLKTEAVKRGLPFVDVSPEMLDPEIGLVSRAFRNPNQLDHHMHYKRAASLWAQKLNATLDDLDPIEAPRHRWRFTQSSFAKALTSPAAELPDELKVRVRPGDELTGRSLASRGEMVLIDGAALNGQRLDKRIRMFHKDHAVLLH